MLKGIEEYDVECSMLKVWCSEMGDYVVDEILAGLKRFTKREMRNTVALRRQVANAAIEQVAYPLG